MKGIAVNAGNYTDILDQFSLQSMSIISDEHMELTLTNGKTRVRRLYFNAKSGIGRVWVNEQLLVIHNVKAVVPTHEDAGEVQQAVEAANGALEYAFDFEGRSLTRHEPEQTTPELTPAEPDSSVPVRHAAYDEILACIQADIPVYLVGEAGTGKNYTLQEIAGDLGLEFYFTNSVQQEYKITGFIDAGGVFHETEFYKAFTRGGLFFLDEMDASIPEVLVLLNAAIANRYFEFPSGRVDASPDFRVVASGNTVGSGANELYTGRLVLDSATLDRFVIINFDYDQNIELKLAAGDQNLVNFVRGLRTFARENGIRATFSYRCIINIVKLEAAKMPLVKIMQIAVFKGLDMDTIRTFRVNNAGKYYFAMEELKKAA